MPKLTIDLEARFAAFQDGLNKIERAATTTTQRLESTFATVGRAFAFTGITVGITALTEFGRRALDSVAVLDDLAKKTALTVQTLDQLRQVATRSGTDFNVLADAAGRFSENLAKARGGDPGLLLLFRNLGISAKELKDSNVDQIFLKVVDVIGRMKDQANANAYAVGLMNRSARELAPAFDDIARKGLPAARVTEAMAAEADRAQKQFAALAFNAQQLQIGLGGALAERINAIAVALDNAATKGENFFTTLGKLARAAAFGSELTQAQRDYANAADEIIKIRKRLNDTPWFMSKSGLQKELAEQEAAMQNAVARINKINEGVQGPAEKKPLATEPPPPPDAGAASALKAAAEKRQKELDDLLKKGVKSEEEAADERYQIAQQLYIDLGQLDRKALQERLELETRAVRNEEEAYIALTDAVEDAYIAQGQIANRLRLQNQMDTLKESADAMGVAITNAFADAIVEGQKFSGVLKGLAKDILRMLSQKYVTGPVATGISAGITGIIGAFQRQAEGGPVSAGSPYIVGERGPELFVPDRHGQIVPNDALGGGAVTVNVNISTGVAATVRSELAQMLPAIQRATTAGVADARFRGAPGLT